ETASSRPKAGTTAPAGSTSIFSSPPVMSLIFLAKSPAYSWKMSFAGQVDCQRMEVGPVAACPLPIIGNASAPAPAAPARNLRRVADVFGATVLSSFMVFSSVIALWERLYCGGDCGDLPIGRILCPGCHKGKGDLIPG